MSLIASDNFNRTNGAIGSNWTVNAGTFNVSSNAIVKGEAGGGVAYWNQNTFPSDQYAQLTIVGPGNTNAFGPAVRIQSAANSGYIAYCFLGGTTLYKLVAGVTTQIATTATGWANNDVAMIKVQGSNLTIYKNGVVLLTGSDTAFTSGSPGIFGGGATDTHGDDWSAGDAANATHNFLRYQRDNR